ncbi:hypothetical protein B9D94_08335 [Paenibacillus sp. Cedars]|nr:hypothetical protein B9D94_08335 [Paenibacillus sp. Cedars]
MEINEQLCNIKELVMKIKISALSTYMITLNFIIFLNLLNMTYNFVRNITSDFKLMQYEGFVINDVEFNNLSFRIHTDSEVFSHFCHPMLLILFGITLNIAYYIIKVIVEGKKANSDKPFSVIK